MANESSNLLDEYEALTRDGIKPTKEEKQRLEIITLKLKDRLGESVLMIDEETGAFKLNTEAVRKQIKIKRLAADDEAATMASRLKGAQEEIKQLDKKNETLQHEDDLRKKSFEQEHEADLEAIRNNDSFSAMEKQKMMERLSGYKEMDKARIKLTQSNNAIYEQEQRRADILKKLKDLNYDEKDIELLFKDNTPTPDGPKEGDTKTIGDQLFRFVNGKWEAVEIKGGGGTGGTGNSGAASKAQQEREDLIRIQQENDRLKASLISDSFKKEMALEEANYQEKIAKLKSQMATEAELKAMTPESRAIAIEKNKELDRQLELEEQTHQYRQGTIIEKGLEDQFKKFQEQYERKKTEREIAHNREMAALGNNEAAKKRLQEQFNEEENRLEVEHLQELINLMNQTIQQGNFKGFDLELLSDDEKQQLLDFLDQLGLKLSELGLKKKDLLGGGGDSTLSSLGGVDILGLTPEQWDQSFSNLDTLEGKINAASAVVAGLTNAWGMYSDFVNKKQEIELRKFEQAQQKKQESLKHNLDRGYINQRQYDDAVNALEKEKNKKQAELEYKRAKREKISTMAGIALNTGLGIMKAVAALPLTGGMPWSAIIGGLGAIQLALAAATPLPAKGYEKGFYKVKREQDGKNFDAAYGGSPTTQLVDKPTVFMAGEQGKNFPEMIIDGRSWKKLNPDLKNSLYRELGRVRGFENGYYNQKGQYTVPAESGPASGSEELMQLFTAALNRNSAVMERIEKEGILAVLSQDFETLRRLKKNLDDYEKTRNANKV